MWGGGRLSTSDRSVGPPCRQGQHVVGVEEPGAGNGGSGSSPTPCSSNRRRAGRTRRDVRPRSAQRLVPLSLDDSALLQGRSAPARPRAWGSAASGPGGRRHPRCSCRRRAASYGAGGQLTAPSEQRAPCRRPRSAAAGWRPRASRARGRPPRTGCRLDVVVGAEGDHEGVGVGGAPSVTTRRAPGSVDSTRLVAERHARQAQVAVGQPHLFFRPPSEQDLDVGEAEDDAVGLVGERDADRVGHCFRQSGGQLERAELGSQDEHSPHGALRPASLP